MLKKERLLEFMSDDQNNDFPVFRSGVDPDYLMTTSVGMNISNCLILLSIPFGFGDISTCQI